jgi:hypothetical protein
MLSEDSEIEKQYGELCEVDGKFVEDLEQEETLAQKCQRTASNTQRGVVYL